MSNTFVIVAIGWILSGVIGAAVAQAKKSSLWQGFCWGLVLGPIGWLITALLPNQPRLPRDLDDAHYAKVERARELAKRAQSSNQRKAQP